MLRTHEERSARWWRYVLDGLALGGPGGAHERVWSVLTVSTGAGDVVARRRFGRDRKAEDARRRFVEHVTAMSDDEHVAADWQVVLDRA